MFEPSYSVAPVNLEFGVSRAIPLAFILTFCFSQGDCGLSFGSLGQCEICLRTFYALRVIFGLFIFFSITVTIAEDGVFRSRLY
jgi:hypothetical protein